MPKYTFAIEYGIGSFYVNEDIEITTEKSAQEAREILWEQSLDHDKRDEVESIELILIEKDKTMKTTAQKLAEKYMRCMIEMWEEAGKNLITHGYLKSTLIDARKISNLIIFNSAQDVDIKELEKYASEYQAITEAPDEAELHEAEIANQACVIKYRCFCGEERVTQEGLMNHYAYSHQD